MLDLETDGMECSICFDKICASRVGEVCSTCLFPKHTECRLLDAAFHHKDFCNECGADLSNITNQRNRKTLTGVQVLEDAFTLVRQAAAQNKKDTDSDWHEKLVESLKECEPYSRPRSCWVAIFALLMIWLLMGVASVLWLLVVQAMGRNNHIAEFLPFVLGFAILNFTLFGPLRFYFYRLGQRSRCRSAMSEVMKNADRRPIVYLRSFELDHLLNRRRWWHSITMMPLVNDEQKLVGELSKYGPVIAIGRPGETFPEVGAARFYAPEHQWQEKISAAIKSAQLVVLVTGASDGLKWEIQHLTNNLSPAELLVWCHPHLIKKSEIEKTEAWTEFRLKSEKYFPKALPPLLGKTKFFVFDLKWTPVAINNGSQKSSLRLALRLLGLRT